MATPAQNNTNSVPPDTLITIKVSVNDSLKKLKLPLRDLGANVLPDKLRHLLAIKPEQTVIFERFSDSAGGYITLDSNNPQVFKTLIRAAKAKLKLRLKATVTPVSEDTTTNEGKMAEEKLPQNPSEPLIVRSPIYQIPRDSTAFDRRSVGSGIFEFREFRQALTSCHPNDVAEAPLPRPFTNENKSNADGQAEQPLATTAGHPWSVYCNECDDPMPNAHFHCSICDGGDYDLCEHCVAAGKLCPGDGHWLIKRFIKDGKVINSTTERISPKLIPIPVTEKEAEKEVPGAFTEDTKTLAEEPVIPTRTCNSCVVVLPEHAFVTCTSCEDFDLCINCHTGNKHGHHPAHAFAPATNDTVLTLAAQSLLAAGRNVRHNAICDGCEKKIYGVRHKCLNCPDWDFCADCIKDARTTHPRHRFAAIYTPIADGHTPLIRHVGIYCDGPLCSGKEEPAYITGVRYKCAVCHDTDFCASCEAIPSNAHNRTHPLIKFKTPVRNVSITTENEDLRGKTRVMGDRRPKPAQTEVKSASTETTPFTQANAATQVRTVAEIMPTEKEVASVTTQSAEHGPAQSSKTTAPSDALSAHFVRDTVADGTVIQPGARFTQVWTLVNPGPSAWPSGCSVRFVGGDNMLDVNNTHPAAVSDIANASETNVTGREIKAGETVGFGVTLKAPTHEGRAISYWRLKSADGTPFGHRLWCDLMVKKPQEETPAPVVQTAPSMMPMPSIPVDAAEQSQLSRMQAMRQQQMALAQHRQQMALAQARQKMQAQHAQQAFAAQAQQAQRALATQQAQPAAMPCTLGQPPAYDASQQANISARIAAMREQQAKRREMMMAQFQANAQRGEAPAQAPKSEAVQTEPEKSEADKARKEAARMRVEFIKAKILRAREEKAKVDEAAATMQSTMQKAAEELLKPNTIVEEKPAENMETSSMVFPKLDKESPSSSTYESASSSSGKGKAAYVENEAGEVERCAAGTPSPVPAQDVASPSIEGDFEDLDGDLEVLSANDEDSEDDGFQTDEEYDILDASDAETDVLSK